MLVLIYAHRTRPAREKRRVGSDCGTRRLVIEVDDLGSRCAGNAAEQRRLANSAWAVKSDDRFVAQQGRDDSAQPSTKVLVQNIRGHTTKYAVFLEIDCIYF